MNHGRFQWLASLWLIGTGVLLLLVPNSMLPEFYHPAYMGVIALLSPAFIHLPSFGVEGKGAVGKKMLLRFRSVAAFSIVVNMLGELGLFQLYRFGFEYDKFAHFAVSMMFSYVACEMLRGWKKYGLALSVLTAGTVVFGFGLLWEVFEYSSDALFGTHEWGMYGGDTLTDTFKDILFNTFGIVLGTVASGFYFGRKRRELKFKSVNTKRSRKSLFSRFGIM